MKAILALALLAVLGFTVAGCGSAKRAVSTTYELTVTKVPVNASGSITVTGITTTTIPNVAAGTRIICKTRQGMGANVKVPRVGATVSEGQLPLTQLGQEPPPEQQIAVTHLTGGSITVSCTHSS